MSNKLDALTKAVFYSQQKPEELAKILESDITDVVTSLSVSGADSIEIPADESVTKTYTAKVFSQYGDEMSGQTITYSLKAEVTGVSISSGTVTVAKTASAGSFTVVATCSSKTAEKTVALVAASAE